LHNYSVAKHLTNHFHFGVVRNLADKGLASVMLSATICKYNGFLPFHKHE
jgi:hypothetical protein